MLVGTWLQRSSNQPEAPLMNHRSGRNRFVALALAVGACLLGLGSAARADDVVTNCANDAQLAAALAGGGAIAFACGTATIPWSATRAISADTTIDGGGLVTLNGTFAFRLFTVSPGTTLTLRNLTLANGYIADANGGGAVFNRGHLILDHVTVRNTVDSAFNGAISTIGPLDVQSSIFTDNKASNGGAIFANGAGAVVKITNSILIGNHATGTGNGGKGGGILATDGARVEVASSDVAGNSAHDGGGIATTKATTALVISSSRITGNGFSGKGGGVYNEGAANLTDVVVERNSGEGTALGGGIYNYGNLEVVNTTLTRNSAYYGAGLSNSFAVAELSNVTFSDNTSTAFGGGFTNLEASLTLDNVTLAGNAAPTGGGMMNESGSDTHLLLRNVLVDAGKSGANCYFQKLPDSIDHNLSSDSSCAFGSGRDGVVAKIGPLETNGGATPTRRLLPGSPAIDAGAFVPTMLTDQRGVTRPRGAAFDVGAFEFVPCSGPPTKPVLLAPTPGGQIGSPVVALDWAGPDCATSFNVVVRRGSKTGFTVFKKTKLASSQATSTALTRRRQYFWQATACKNTQCASSAWSSFTVK